MNPICLANTTGSLQRWFDPRVILVATNLHDRPALMCHAVAEAKRNAARLLLVHVIPPPAAPSEDAPAGPPRVLLLPCTHSAADALEQMALQLRWQGVLCEPIVLKGRPDDQIGALVQSRRVDRVIVATPGRRPPGASPHPSLADLLIAALPVPVCVVSGNIDPAALIGPAKGRVLLALSLRSLRRDYVDFACGVAEARRARLTLLHVIDPSAGGHRERASAHDAARLRLAALAAARDDPPWRPDIAVRDGNPATQIVEQALCPFQDLIVLASSSLTLPSPGSGTGVIRRVIAESRCPVITFKPSVAEVRTVPAAAWPILRTGSLD